MKGMFQIGALLFFFMIGIGASAQTSTVQNLYFKGSSNTDFGDVFAKPDYRPGKKNFYIYRNFIYFFKFKNKESYWLKVTDIRNDSIYYIRYYNLLSDWRNKHTVAPDTLHVHPSAIRAVGKDAIGKMGRFRTHSLRGSDFVFTRSNQPKGGERNYKTTSQVDPTFSTTYEMIPYLTRTGVDSLSETVSTTYVPPDPKPARVYRDRNVLWFSPTNASTVRGVNIGLLTMSLKQQPFNIYGVNLNADVASFIFAIYGLALLSDNSFAHMADTVDLEYDGTMKGISISGGGLFMTSRVHGLSINGVMFFADEMKGVVVTGTQSMCTNFAGVMISGLRNRSVKGRGVQVGLLNVCRDFKGIQVGLWNINGKRKLPFINWGA